MPRLQQLWHVALWPGVRHLLRHRKGSSMAELSYHPKGGPLIGGPKLREGGPLRLRPYLGAEPMSKAPRTRGPDVERPLPTALLHAARMSTSGNSYVTKALLFP